MAIAMEGMVTKTSAVTNSETTAITAETLATETGHGVAAKAANVGAAEAPSHMTAATAEAAATVAAAAEAAATVAASTSTSTSARLSSGSKQAARKQGCY